MNDINRILRYILFDVPTKTEKSNSSKIIRICETKQPKTVEPKTTIKTLTKVNTNVTKNLKCEKPKIVEPDTFVKPKGQEIDISKIGSDHVYYDICNQDYVLRLPNIKIALDGCGSCKFSEIGVKLFSQILSTRADEINENNFERIVSETFEELLTVFKTDKLVCDNLLFTIVACIETENSYHVFYVGDGFIITNNGLQIDLINLEEGEYPAYYAYNYIKNKKLLMAHSNGVIFNRYSFSKKQYKNIGVATDGIRYYMELEPYEQIMLWKALRDGNKMVIIKMLNNNKNLFKDDVTICM